ncbi:hypothetical protein HRG_000136 [Hirsutella rhossiliensis]|uniref:Uncharacterized protein n=1 Tax=Hirsutella rhossiliensis TaxID=111463 RepID=A0A9P8N669_9HYPO|nr:uncharacterized protein HRG_00136 [Hirsutella rhossiliensis]KAH0967494.1 hypothetical protein HRG_00136 [Hirsutella rhossiliensis]
MAGTETTGRKVPAHETVERTIQELENCIMRLSTRPADWSEAARIANWVDFWAGQYSHATLQRKISPVCERCMDIHYGQRKLSVDCEPTPAEVEIIDDFKEALEIAKGLPEST